MPRRSRFAATSPSSRRFDIAGGARFGFLVAGVSYSQSAPVLSWEGSAEVPYPFRPDWRRSIAVPGMSAPAQHRVFRLDLGATVPLGRRVEVAVFGGPAMHSLSYSSPSDLTFAFEYPFETATGQSLLQVPATASTIGYHAGADLGFYPVRNLGFGILIGYRPNPLQIEVRDVAVDVGGSPLLVQAGARVRF